MFCHFCTSILKSQIRGIGTACHTLLRKNGFCLFLYIFWLMQVYPKSYIRSILFIIIRQEFLRLLLRDPGAGF